MLGNDENRSAAELARLFLLKKDYYYNLLAEKLLVHDSTGALSPLPGKKILIRCDRLISVGCGCFGKKDSLCMSGEKCTRGSQTGMLERKGERERERERY